MRRSGCLNGAPALLLIPRARRNASSQANTSKINDSLPPRAAVDRHRTPHLFRLGGVGGSSSSAGNLSLPFVRSGRRLISYGPDLVEQYRQAAGYIDCEKPANLPVQPSTKFELVFNLKTPLRHSASKCR